jgi:RNA polymerase sigma factor (sigma-70 family)
VSNSGFHDEYGNEVALEELEQVEALEDEEQDEPGLPEIILAMATLTERQRFVVECRFGLRSGMPGERVNYREIASWLGVHHSTIQEIEQAGLKKLRVTLQAAL